MPGGDTTDDGRTADLTSSTPKIAARRSSIGSRRPHAAAWDLQIRR
jgi:hypothetical protein